MLGRVIIAAMLFTQAGCTVLGEMLFGAAPPSDGSEGGECGDGTCDSPGEDCLGCSDDCGQCPDGDKDPIQCDMLPPPVLVEYSAVIEPLIIERCTGCHFDGGFPPDFNTMEGLHSVVEPCDCEDSLIVQKLSPTPPYGDRMPQDGPPFLSEVERRAICDWIEEGARAIPDPEACGPLPQCDEVTCGDGQCAGGEDCSVCTADCGICPPDDVDPPAFTGVNAVTKLTSTRCKVAWTEATDDRSSRTDLTYRVYAGPDGTIDYSYPVAEIDAHTEALVTFEAGRRYPIAVRAVDAAGNEDVNTRALACNLL